MARWPLVVKPSDVRQTLSGTGMADYWAALGNTTSQDEYIEDVIQGVQGRIELELGILLTQRVIKTRPVANDAEFDMQTDALPFFANDFNNGTGQIELKFKPLVSVERVVLRYGGKIPGTTFTVLEFPKEWIDWDNEFGIVYLKPLYGAAGVVAGTLGLAMISQSFFNGNAIPTAIAVDYVAGILPRDLDVLAGDDPLALSPDYEIRDLLRGIKFLCAADMLTSLDRALGAGGGAIGIDGLSESFQAGRFGTEIQKLEKIGEDSIKRYRERTQPIPMIII